MIRFVKKLINFIGSFILILLIIAGLYTVLSHFQIQIKGIEEPGRGTKIGVVTLKGIISNAKPIIDELSKFQKDPSIKAIILRIDSPGGMVGPTQEIWEKVVEVRKEKKVYTSIGSIGASGAYYIASASDFIMANPGSIVGSIGVVIEFPNVKGLMDKVGIKMNVIKTGKFKDTGSPFREMSEEEKEYLKEVIENVYEQFVRAVSIGRGIGEEKLLPIADGRILSGEMAKKVGLVDDTGGIEKLKEKIKKDLKAEKLKLVYPPKKTGVLSRILWGKNSGPNITSILEKPGLYYLWKP